MNVKRSILTMVGVLAATVTAVSTAGGAQAALPSNHDTAGQVLTVAGSSPSVYPAARQIRWRAPGDPLLGCATGNLCLEVWDSTSNLFKIFDLYKCNRYALSNWTGTGTWNNQQTGGAFVHFYDQYGYVIRSFTLIGMGTQHWGPVYSVRNC